MAPAVLTESASAKSLRVAEVVSALSQALDLGSGASAWHSVRTCILGMRIAAEVGLDDQVRSDLYYALILKDAGCSSNASEIFHALDADEISAKRDAKLIDWTRTSRESVDYALKHVAIGKSFSERLLAFIQVAARQKAHTRHVTAVRCERGATMARLMGLEEGTAAGIAGLDEHWDGSGHPGGLRREKIPITSRIMLLAQTLDVFFTSVSPEGAIDVAVQRSARWFDPSLVKAVRSLAARGQLWSGLCQGRDQELALQLEPGHKTLADGHNTLDRICQAFAQIVDGKSPFTFNHSNGVANAAVAIAEQLDFSDDQILFVRHAALLHDLGKMAVSNAILEKPGKLDESEWQSMRSHPEFTLSILRSVHGFEHLAEIAASHHEKLDGSGYFRGLTADQLPLEARILVVADIFDALAADRPYRAAMPMDKIFAILHEDAPRALDSDCVDALERSGVTCDQTFRDVHTLQVQLESWGTRSRSADADPVRHQTGNEVLSPSRDMLI